MNVNMYGRKYNEELALFEKIQSSSNFSRNNPKTKGEMKSFSTLNRDINTQDKTKRSTGKYDEKDLKKKKYFLENKTDLGSNSTNNMSYSYMQGDLNGTYLNQNYTMQISNKNFKVINSPQMQVTIDKGETRAKTSRNSRPISPKSLQYTMQLDILNHVITSQALTSKCRSPGERLHDESVLLKAKLEEKRIINELERRKSMKPNISQKSKEIERDPQLFGERLYPYHRIEKNKSLKKSGSSNISLLDDLNSGKLNFRDMYGNKSSVDIYRKQRDKHYDDFDFRPKINKKSLELAAKMEPSVNRLMKKKKRVNKSCEEISLILKRKNKANESMCELTSRLTGRNQTLNRSNLTCSNLNNSMHSNLSLTPSQRSITKSKELYEKGLESLKKKELIHMQKLKEESETYKQYKFKPEIIKTTRESEYIQSISNNCSTKMSKFSSRCHSPAAEYIINKETDFYKKTSNWKDSLKARTDRNKSKKDLMQRQQCTFTPKISNFIPEPDVKFIKKNLPSSHKYVYKRRVNLQKDEEQKEYANKKLNYGEKFLPKPTVPKEFNLSKSKSRRSMKETNDPKILHKPDSINILRKKLSTEKFFNYEDEDMEILQQ